MLLKMKSLLSFLVVLFVLVVPCSATDNVSFFSRNASLLNGSLSILATASLTYEFGLADYRLAGRTCLRCRRDYRICLCGLLGCLRTSILAQVLQFAMGRLLRYFRRRVWCFAERNKSAAHVCSLFGFNFFVFATLGDKCRGCTTVSALFY